jgi:hypothetical protein
MSVDLTSLIGKRLLGAAKRDYTWSFVFSEDSSVSTESAWRLVTKNGIVVTSEDHGHPFGLKEAVDSAARALAATKERKILGVLVADQTGDLSLRFEEEVRLEFLNLSCGYESWRAQTSAGEVICLGGGQLAMFPNATNG